MLTNRIIAELLARAAEREEDHRARALRRAARAALTWGEEVADVAAASRSLTELAGVGPWVARHLHEWLDAPPEHPEPPATRRGFGTLAEARRAIDEHPDIHLRADLQMHTHWSDGSASIREMAEASAAIGHEYIAITDHSKGLPIARGKDEASFARQAEEVETVNRDLERDGVRIRVLHGIEMNLSPDGAGDMDPGMLATLDLVLGAFHSKLRVKEDQTERYRAALANPTIHVLAHPRGRKWNMREGLRADWREVARAAAAHGKALEIDGYPDRQDADLELLAEVRQAGGFVSIGTDAHHPWELAYWEMGLGLALRAKIPPERILNLMPRGDLMAWVADR